MLLKILMGLVAIGAGAQFALKDSPALQAFVVTSYAITAADAEVLFEQDTPGDGLAALKDRVFGMELSEAPEAPAIAAVQEIEAAEPEAPPPPRDFSPRTRRTSFSAKMLTVPTSED